ncbi:unnamed protein product [Schistocephalus solidus]|uniref:SH3 domain-containing protein n=1 Tax=Schistocephalus solidus TaxID=70667 RepID=A0A183TCW6_SCHSO|nr:unnamed protein product [Schistocephalus solidus]
MRGEPLRARFCLNGIRLALKPEAPYNQTGGFAVVGKGTVGTPAPYDSPFGGRKPVQYHLMAILKCVGEGRLYHTYTITLMRVCDLPVGSARAAPFIDLPANIKIVHLQPDFLITIEIYCMIVGDLDSISEAGLNSLTGPDALNSPVPATPKRGLGFCISGSLLSSAKRKKMRSKSTVAVDSTPIGGGGMLARFAAKQTPGRRIPQTKESMPGLVLIFISTAETVNNEPTETPSAGLCERRPSPMLPRDSAWVIVENLKTSPATKQNLRVTDGEVLRWINFEEDILNGTVELGDDAFVECEKWTGEGVVLPSEYVRVLRDRRELAGYLSKRPRAEVISDYAAESPKEVGLRAGELIYLHYKMDNGNFYASNKFGQRCVVPLSVLNILTPCPTAKPT